MLVYLTVFGFGYERFARQAITTLRHPRLGNYKGKLIVFTDDPCLRIESAETRLFNLPEGDQFYWSCRARIDAGLSLDITNDFIMYLDSDFVCAQDVAPLFSVTDKLHYHEEATPLWRSIYANAYLTAEEMAKVQAENLRTINAGMFVLPGAMAGELFERWLAMVEADPHRQAVSNNPTPDQSALNAIIRRGEIPSQAMPYDWVVQPIPLKEYPDAKMIHFAGRRKDNPNEIQRRYLELVGRKCNALIEERVGGSV